MRHFYKKEELNLMDDSPEEQTRVRKIFLTLKDKAKQGKFMTEIEKDFMGICLKLSKIDKETVDEFPTLDNYKFKSLYLIYFRDLTGGSKYTKYIGEELYTPIATEVRNDLDYLYQKANEWDNLLNKKVQSTELLSQVSTETRNEIKCLENVPEFKSDPFIKGRFTYRFKKIAILLQSKYIYCKSLEWYELYDPSDFILTLNNLEIEITSYSIIHILTRHFSKITKQYPTKKSFHNDDFMPEFLPQNLKRIFEAFEESNLLNAFRQGNIQFRYKKRDYSIWISEKRKTIKGMGTIKYLRVDTFYPIEDNHLQQKLKTDLKLIQINPDLGLYI
jgi:hypothetical protein